MRSSKAGSNFLFLLPLTFHSSGRFSGIELILLTKIYSMRSIGLDIGFGHTKVVWDEGSLKFPSWVAYWTGTGLEDIKPIEFDGAYFVVGEPAKFAKRVEIAGVDELIKYYPLFTKYVLEVLRVPAKQALVITGLPPRYISRAEEVKRSLSAIGVKSLIVFQGFGVYYDVKEKGISSGLVVDIGFNTVDYLAFSVEGEQFIKELAGSIASLGVINAVLIFRDLLPSNLESLRAKSPSSLINVFVQGRFKQYDLSEYKRKAVEQWNEMLKSRLRQEIGSLFLEKDTLIIAGGGAYLVSEEVFEQEVVIPDEPEFSNARGYWKIGK